MNKMSSRKVSKTVPKPPKNSEKVKTKIDESVMRPTLSRTAKTRAEGAIRKTYETDTTDAEPETSKSNAAITKRLTLKADKVNKTLTEVLKNNEKIQVKRSARPRTKPLPKVIEEKENNEASTFILEKKRETNKSDDALDKKIPILKLQDVNKTSTKQLRINETRNSSKNKSKQVLKTREENENSVLMQPVQDTKNEEKKQYLKTQDDSNGEQEQKILNTKEIVSRSKQRKNERTPAENRENIEEIKTDALKEVKSDSNNKETITLQKRNTDKQHQTATTAQRNKKTVLTKEKKEVSEGVKRESIANASSVIKRSTRIKEKIVDNVENSSKQLQAEVTKMETVKMEKPRKEKIKNIFRMKRKIKPQENIKQTSDDNKPDALAPGINAEEDTVTNLEKKQQEVKSQITIRNKQKRKAATPPIELNQDNQSADIISSANNLDIISSDIKSDVEQQNKEHIPEANKNLAIERDTRQELKDNNRNDNERNKSNEINDRGNGIQTPETEVGASIDSTDDRDQLFNITTSIKNRKRSTLRDSDIFLPIPILQEETKAELSPPKYLDQCTVNWEEHQAELVPCRKCKRKYFPHRIQKHEECCKKS